MQKESNQERKRPPGFILNLLGIGTAIALLGDATLYTVLPHPEISAHLGITLSMVGLLLGANRAVRLIINGPVGYLYDRCFCPCGICIPGYRQRRFSGTNHA